MRELEHPELRATRYETAEHALAAETQVKARLLRAAKKQKIFELLGPNALRRATIKRMANDGVDATEAEQRILWRQ